MFRSHIPFCFFSYGRKRAGERFAPPPHKHLFLQIRPVQIFRKTITQKHSHALKILFQLRLEFVIGHKYAAPETNPGYMAHERKQKSKVKNGKIRYVKQTADLTHVTHVNGWEPAHVPGVTISPYVSGRWYNSPRNVKPGPHSPHPSALCRHWRPF